MIDENITFILFGYTSDMLKPNSNKKVWKICDICKEKRLIKYRKYTNLCHQCSHRTKEYRLKQSESNKGRHHTEETKQKISNSRKGNKNPMYGKHPSEETKQKMSNSHKGNKNPQWKGGKKLRFARRHTKRRKLFGFIPHNKPQDNFHGHHIDFNHVIFIPKELHMNISHSVIKNINMDLINNAVCDWYLKYQIIK